MALDVAVAYDAAEMIVGALEDAVEVVDIKIELDLMTDMVEGKVVLITDVCLTFHPTIAIAPTVDRLADTVVVMIDQAEPSSV